MTSRANLSFVAVLLAGLAHPQAVLAVTCTSTAAGGNWNATATWTGCTGGNGTVADTPGTNDDAIIATSGGSAVTVNVASSAISVTVNSGAILTQSSSLTTSGILTVAGTMTSTNTMAIGGATGVTGTLNITSTTGTHTFTGDVTVGGIWNVSVAEPVSFGGNLTINNSAGAVAVSGALNIGGNLDVQSGTISVANTLAVTGTTSISGTLSITSTTGTKTFTGDVTVGGTWNVSVAEPVSFGGNLTNNGTFTSGTGLQTFTSASAQWAGSAALTFSGAATASSNLTINKSAGAVAVSGALNVGGNLVVQSGTISVANTLAVTGTTSISGTLSITSTTGTKTFTGSVTINSGGTLSESVAELITYNGNVTIANGGTLTEFGAATMAFAGNLANDGSYTASTGVHTFSGASKTFSGANTISIPRVTISGTYQNNGTLTVGTTLTVAAGATLTPAAGVIISGTGTLTGSGTVQVTRTAATADFSSQYTIASKTLANLTVEYVGTGAQEVSALTYGGLKISNSNGVTLSAGNATVNGTLTLASGNITTTGANTIIVSSTGTVSRTSGHVIGNLQKNVATGATSRTFEIGDANAYAPVTIAFGSVTTAGNLIATTIAGEHPDIARSAIDSTQDVNRYWTVTNSGVIFTNYSATFTYASGTPVDLDSGVTPSLFSIGKADACDGSVQNCTWTYPTVVGTPTSTSAQASGMTGFSHFAVGRKVTNFLVEAAGGGSIGTQVQTFAFNIRITARDAVNNTVTSFTGTVQITSGCTLSAGSGTSANFVNGVLASWSVTISNTGTCTITATRSSGTENGTSNSFTVGADASQFDGCEYTTPRCTPGSANFDRLFTKLANNGFTLDLVALRSGGALGAGFSGTVAVDLLANSVPQSVGANNCPASQTATISLGNSTFSGGRPTAPISVAANAFSSVSPNYSAYRDVRVRVTCNIATCPPGGITYCSADNFAVRPQDFSVSSNMTNTAQTGAPGLAAGADFALAATAVAGYALSPQLDRTANKVATHVGLTDYTTRLRDSAGANTIIFPAATIASGASTATVQYHDAGNFRVLAAGIVDSSFSSVDDPSKGDCVSGSSSNADNDGNANNGLVYGCDIANQNNSNLFGRFFPGYYVVSGSPSVSAACTAGGYSYMGDAHIGLGFTISAMSQDNPGGATLKLSHFTSGYGTLASANVVAEDGTTATDLSGNFTPSLAYVSTNWSSGDYAVSGTSYAFSRPASAPSGPYDNLYVAAGVTDTDGAALTGSDFKLGDPTCTVSCTHKKLSASSTRIRFGRIYLPNAYGTEKLDLTVPLEAQYWTGSIWARNTLDGCTAIAASNMALGNYSGGLSAANFGASHLSLNAISQGLGTITLTKPSPAATGSVDLAINLGVGATASICPAWTPTATGAGMAHLRGQWCGANYDKDPDGKITLGVSRSNFIFFRENY